MTMQLNPGCREPPLESAATPSTYCDRRPRLSARHASTNIIAERIMLSDFPYVRTPVGVLPFVNIADEPTVDGLSDEFTNGVVEAIRAISGTGMAKRSSTLPTSLSDVHYLDIGRWLEVDLLLIGEVTNVGDNLYANAQLVFAASGLPVRSFRFERKASVPFNRERSVAAQLARWLEEVLPRAARPASVGQRLGRTHPPQ